jgi:hypothetical protein
MIQNPHNTRVLRVETDAGFPSVQWTDDQQHSKSFWTTFSNQPREDGSNRYMACAGQFGDGLEERRGAIIEALNSLEWAEGRNCLASAPWVPPLGDFPQEVASGGAKL